MKKINRMYIIAAILSNYYFITKYLLYRLYFYAKEHSLILIFVITAIVLGLAPLIYRYIGKVFTKQKSKYILYALLPYLFISSLFSLIALQNFISVHWLSSTSPISIIFLITFLGYYSLSMSTKNLYKAYAFLSPIVILTLLVFIFSKTSLLHVKEIPPFMIDKSYFSIIILSLMIILEVFFICFIPSIQQTPLSKKSYYQYLIFMILLLLGETIIEINEFNGIIQYIVFPFFESFNIIYFGQYIGYLNFPVLCIYMIGCFSKLSLNTKILQQQIPLKWIQVFYILLIVSSTSFLLHAEAFTTLQLPMIMINLLSILLALILYPYKERRSPDVHHR